MRRLAIIAVAFASTAACADSANGRFQSILDFPIGSSTLASIQERLGPATEFDVPESHHESAVCYESVAPAITIMFSTDGEFGGPEKHLMGFLVRVTNDNHFPCAPLPARHDSVSVDGLALGMSESALRSLLGLPPDLIGSGLVRRRFESERPFRPEDRERHRANERDVFDVSHTVWGVVKEGKVVEYGAWIVETY